MQYTTNANMKKPGYADTVNINDINDNFDTTDEHIGDSFVSTEGIHGLRFNTDERKLQVYDESSSAWVDAVADEAPNPVLNDNSWETIHKFSATGANYWNVGDCKSVLVNGTIGTLAVNETFWVYILSFNHNEAIEGKGIHFGCFKTDQADGTDICLVDSYCGNYTSYNGTKYFQMNHRGNSNNYNTNYGGWAACDMRYDILGSTDNAPTPYGSTKTTTAIGQDPSDTCTTNPVPNTLMAALPADLRAVMQPMIKYTDNKGNSSNVAANVTKTIDYLPLLAEFEIFGKRSRSNQYEQNYQAQYVYYSTGNSQVKYRHSSTGSTAQWWERSPRYDDIYSFCFVSAATASGNLASLSCGIAPVFMV